MNKEKKIISNEEFEKAYKDENNIKLMKEVISRFGFDYETSKDIQMTSLLRCLKGHKDNKGQKFTSSLWRFTTWECLRELKKMKKEKKFVSLSKDRSVSKSDNSIEIQELLNKLPQNEQELIQSYFFEGSSVTKLCRINRCPKKVILKKINEILKNLRGIYNE